MEGVAAGAQTGKAAVHRRWPSKEDLVADALRAGLPSFDDVPEMGSVREGLPELCRRAREAMFSRPGFAMRSVIHECDASRAQCFQAVIFGGVVEPTFRLFGEVVDRGIQRGEIRPDAANSYVFDAIPAMMMNRSKVCASEWNERDIEEAIDRLMVPLLRPTGA